MKGIAPLLIGAIILFAAGAGLVFSAVAPHGPGYANSSRNVSGNLSELPAIGTEALTNFPLPDFWSFLFAGVTGAMRYITTYIILPLGNWFASYAAGHPVVLPVWIAYVLIILLFLILFYKKWTAIWDFVMRNLIIIVVAVAAIFLIGVVLAYLGLI